MISYEHMSEGLEIAVTITRNNNISTSQILFRFSHVSTLIILRGALVKLP